VLLAGHPRDLPARRGMQLLAPHKQRQFGKRWDR
jgi:hypothetical protein